jgi:hypothetical protein
MDAVKIASEGYKEAEILAETAESTERQPTQ